jgi:hypothetical protein
MFRGSAKVDLGLAGPRARAIGTVREAKAIMSTRLRSTLIAGLLVLAAILGAYLALRNHARHDPAAIIVAGAHDTDELHPDVDDENLQDDEAAAGALWAKHHPGEGCPTDPPAFHRGCQGAVGSVTGSRRGTRLHAPVPKRQPANSPRGVPTI